MKQIYLKLLGLHYFLSYKEGYSEEHIKNELELDDIELGFLLWQFHKQGIIYIENELIKLKMGV